MSKRVEQLAVDGVLAREGDAWVLLMMSGASTQADARALRLWRLQSPAHERAFREAVRLRKLIRRAAVELRGDRAASGRSPEAANDVAPQLSRRTILTGAIAASAAVAGTYAGGRALHLWPSEGAADFATAKGERRVVTLGSGVSAQLGTLTRLRRRPDLGVHGVELVSGEVILTARTSRDRPLVALAGPGRAIADAARFSVRCVGPTVAVTCLDGAVTVEVGADRRAVPAGRQLVYGRDGVEAVVPVDPSVVTAWQRGVLVFRRQTVGAVIGEINRYRPGRIVVVDSVLANRRIDGTFYVGQLDEIFDQLHSAFGARVTRLPGGMVVLA